MALIHAVEALKYAALVLRRDADAGILHSHNGAGAALFSRHIDRAAVAIILDRVVAEVENGLRHKPPHAADVRFFAVDAQRHMLRCGRTFQRGCRLLADGVQLKLFIRKLAALVELRKADDIIDQCDKARRLGADMPDEARHILLLHKAVFDQLGAAHDGLERCFQLVRHIRREFAAVSLCEGLLRHVKREQHRTDDRALGLNAADVQLILPAAARKARLTVAGLHGVIDRDAQLMAALDGQEILPDAALVRMEQCPRGGIDAQNDVLFVHQDEALIHAGCDLRKFVLLLLELLQLRVDLPALAADARQKRRELLVGVVFQRVFQIKPVQRRDHARGNALCKEKRQQQRGTGHDQHGLEHTHGDHADGRAADRNAEHAAIGHAPRIIDGLFQKRIGVAGAFALAGLQGLAHLVALGVIFHRGLVCLRVKPYRAVCSDPSQAIAFAVDGLEIGFAGVFNAGHRQRQLVLQLLLLHAGKIVVQAAHDDQDARQQHRHNGEHDRLKDFFRHVCASSR